MKSWLRWILIVTQVGGGFTGFVVCLAYLQNTEDLPFAARAITVAFMALYAVITAAGVIFAREARRTGLMRVGLWVQIPWISSPLLTWQLSAGLSIVLGLNEQGPTVAYSVGSFWQFSLLMEKPWELGINFFPVLMLILLARAGQTQAEVRPGSLQEGKPPGQVDERPLAAQVNAILQSRLVDTPLAERGVRLQLLQDGGASVAVGGCLYASVDEVPEEDIRLAIRSAIAEWESRGPA